MITFELEIGGQIKIQSMSSEESGLVSMFGVGRFLKEEINTGFGVHGCLAIQFVKGIGNTSIPNDIRYLLEDLGLNYTENKTKGFVEIDPAPIPTEEVR